MQHIALNVPGLSGSTNIPNPPGLRFTGSEKTSLGYVTSEFFNLIFYIAIFLTFIYFVWGAYQYIMAQGQKEALNAARERIRYSLIGFILLVMAFLVGNWAPSIFPFIRTFYAGQVPKIESGSTNRQNESFTQPQEQCKGGKPKPGEPCIIIDVK